MNRPTWLRPGAGWAALLTLAAAGGTARAGQLSNDTYPPASVFRNLQLITLACGRENTQASCSKAQSLADPMLDHPRLQASCKDVLWSIRQQARTAETNSLERRDRIDKAARNLTLFCRQPNLAGSTPTPTGGGGLGPGISPGSPPPGR